MAGARGAGRGPGRVVRAGWAAVAAVGLLAVALVVVPGSAVAASVLRVCAHGCAYTQIQPAVDAVSAGDTVAVGPGSYAGGIVIAKALRVSGAGAGATVISGGGPVITVSAGPVLLRGVTVTGGSAPGDGGGILNTGTLTVAGVTISGNAASGNGGGIANDEPTAPGVLQTLLVLAVARSPATPPRGMAAGSPTPGCPCRPRCTAP